MAVITCPRCSRTADGSNFNNSAGKQVCGFCAIDLADPRADPRCRGGNYNSRDAGTLAQGIPSP